MYACMFWFVKFENMMAAYVMDPLKFIYLILLCMAVQKRIVKYMCDSIPLDNPKTKSGTSIHNMGAHLGWQS